MRTATRGGLALLALAVSGETCSVSTDTDGRLRTATIEVSTVTTGTNLDADGYRVVVRRGLEEIASASIGSNDSVRFTDLRAETEFTVELRDVASNCEVRPPNPVRIFVEDGATVQTTFEVECGPG